MANSRTTTLFKTFLILFLCAATLQNANAQSASAKTRISAQTDIASILLSPDTGTKSAATSALLAKASRPDASLRARLVNMDFPALNRTYARITAEAAPQTIQIPFFDDAIFVVQINRTEPTSSGGIAYIGNVPDDPQSIVVLVINDGAVSINLAARGQRYEIHGSAESGFVARQKSAIDRPDHPPTKLDLTGPKFFEVPSATTTKGSPQAGAKASLTTTPLAAATLADDGSIIDVMVVYTPAARLSQTPGTAAQMNANIDAQIALTNQVYANSLVVQRLRLVYKGEVNYNEINMDVDLPRLEITNDGFMDEVHILRDLYAADLVSLWGVYTDYCGLGSLMSTEAASFASAGFNVVASPACTGAGGYTFAHELGHNMGLRHDNFVDTTANTTVTPAGSTTPTTITYAHGYIDLTNRFRTVMSYNDQCVATIGSAPPTFGCTRIPYFSNPAVSYNNNPPYLSAMPATTGNATNAHEQRALNDTRETVANFRLGLTTFTGPGIVAFIPANYSVSEGAGSVTLSVARHVGSTGAITVNYASVNGTATAGADYTAVSNTLSWADGDTSVQTITVPILQDAILEGTEKFTVVLSGATGGASVGSAGGVTATATVSIIDDEADNFPPGGVVPATYVTPASGTGGAWTVETTDGYLSPTSLRSAQTLSAALSTTNFVNSDLEFTGDFAAGNLSFAYMLSSYPTYQQFEFFIDNGVVVSNTGGESGWVPVTQAISASTHTLRWRFKSGLSFLCANAIPAAPGGANCKNRVFIDAVSLPLTLPTLGILKNGTGTGTVTGTGINCGADCVETTTAGASFTLTATPAIDSSFAGWSGGGCSGTGTCTVMLAASLNVTATFNILPEAFPANCALPVGWTVPAAAYGGWTVAMDRKRSGACSLKSTPMPNAPAPGAANANKSQIQVSGNYGAGNVSFYYNVSSEADYDCLRFFVDTVARAEMGNCNGPSGNGGFGASGDITDWTTPVSIPVAAGAHTFLWSYEKDESGFNGSDAAWIDDVTLPPAVPVTLTTAKAGNGAGTITGTGINCGIGCTVNVAPGTVMALSAVHRPAPLLAAGLAAVVAPALAMSRSMSPPQSRRHSPCNNSISPSHQRAPGRALSLLCLRASVAARLARSYITSVRWLRLRRRPRRGLHSPGGLAAAAVEPAPA